MITASKAKTHLTWKRLFSSARCSNTTSWQSYLFSWGLSLSFYLGRTGPCSRSRGPRGLSWETWTTLAACGSAVSFRHGKQMDKSISCCRKLYVVLLSQPCGKEMTANSQCQTNLLQLTCAANVEPSDPDLDGNHCKYFPARFVEGAFSRAFSAGNLSNCKWLWLPPVCVICSLRSSKHSVYLQTIQQIPQYDARCGAKCNKTVTILFISSLTEEFISQTERGKRGSVWLGAEQSCCWWAVSLFIALSVLRSAAGTDWPLLPKLQLSLEAKAMLQIFGLATEFELYWHRKPRNKKQQPWEQLCKVKRG